MANHSQLHSDRRFEHTDPSRSYYMSSTDRSQVSSYYLPSLSSSGGIYSPYVYPSYETAEWETSTHTSNNNDGSNNHPFHTNSTVYPESSQRTIHSASPLGISPPQSASPPLHIEPPSIPPFSSQNDRCRSSPGTSDTSNWDPAQHPVSPVKVEPDDTPAAGCFIMDGPQSTFGGATMSASQALALPIEVPLRATQACSKMRRMMGSFRVNPFAMHSGGGRAMHSGGDDNAMQVGMNVGGTAGQDEARRALFEARPLDSEPLIFEFQLSLDDYPADDDDDDNDDKPNEDEPQQGDVLTQGPLPTDEKNELRSFSPGFELHSEKNDYNEYRAEPQLGRQYRSRSDPAFSQGWELQYPKDLTYPHSNEHFLSSESTTTATAVDHATVSGLTTAYGSSNVYDSPTAYESPTPTTSDYSTADFTHARNQHSLALCSPSDITTASSHPYLRKSPYQQPGYFVDVRRGVAMYPQNYREPNNHPYREVPLAVAYRSPNPSAYRDTPPSRGSTSTYGSDSPRCDPEVLPHISMGDVHHLAPENVQSHGLMGDLGPQINIGSQPSRRWSLPEGVNPGGSFLMQ